MIKNRSELLSHGFVEGREKALDIAEYALGCVDPYAAVKHHVRLEGSRLLIAEDSFDLDKVDNIYAIGAGKATYPAVHGLEKSRADAERLVEQALRELDHLSGDVTPLKALAHHFIDRMN